MSDDEKQVRDLILSWAEAVHTGDLPGVLADHTTDIVMFDVPPPDDGVRGLDAYRETWPPFFTWQAGGATFEVVELEVVAGADVAFAYALLRAAPRTSTPSIPNAGCASASVCNAATAGGRSATSTTRSRWRQPADQCRPGCPGHPG